MNNEQLGAKINYFQRASVYTITVFSSTSKKTTKKLIHVNILDLTESAFIPSIHLSTFLFLFLHCFLSLSFLFLLKLFFFCSVLCTSSYLFINSNTKSCKADQQRNNFVRHPHTRPFFLRNGANIYDSDSFAAAVSIGVLIALKFS